ncbi:MAG: hypothetical protein WB439_18060 [Acidobacteriaceae bacterium]
MTQISHIALVLAASLLLASSLSAQQSPSTSSSTPLQTQLQRLGAVANAQILSLPNFTCEEAATSQFIRDQKAHSTVHMQGTVRVIRKPNGVIAETYTYKRQFHLLFIPRFLPYFVSGGFEAPLTYFLPAAQACYQYTLSPGRIDFATRTGPVPGHICRERGLKGFALLNAASDVTHIQRTLPEAVAKPLKLAPFAAVDLAPVNLNGNIYLLSQHIIATQPLGNGEGHFEATYTNCRLFTSSVTIGPATEVPPTRASEPQ